MRPSFLNLSLIALLSAFSVSAAAKDATPFYGTLFEIQDGELTPYTKAVEGYAIVKSERLGQILNVPNSDKDKLEKVLRATFNEFCGNGKQKKPIKQTITAILPAPPKGVAIDEAATIHSNMIKRIRNIVENYYVEAAITALESKAPTIQEVVEQVSKKTFHTKAYMGIGKDLAFGGVTLERVNQLKGKPDTLSSPSAEQTFAFFAVPKNKEDDDVYLTQANSLVEWFKVPPKNQYDYDEDWFKEPDHAQPMNVSINHVSDPQIYVIDERTKIEFKVEDKKASYMPIVRAGYMDLNLLFNGYFLLVMPDAEQKKLFPKDEHYKWNFGVVPENNADLKAGYSVSEHVKAAPRVALQYLMTHTKVQEAVGANKNLMKFEVRLQMDDFCKYAKPVSEFVSK